MTPLFILTASPIAGNGIFALQPIARGQLIHVMAGERCTADEIVARIKGGNEELSDPLAIGEHTYLDLDSPSRIFNHSCNPNACIREVSSLVAIRDIAPGEEITFDYSTTMHYREEDFRAFDLEPWTMPCACGADTCRGIVDQFASLPDTTRAFYLGQGWMPDFMLALYGGDVSQPA